MFTAERRGSGAGEPGVSLVRLVTCLLSALGGLVSAAVGFVLNNTAMIVAGMILGGSGSILGNLMANAMSRRPRSGRTRKVTSASHFIDRGGR
jgi:hypothetical protein